MHLDGHQCSVFYVSTFYDRRCGQHYVGETGQQLYCRINNHVSTSGRGGLKNLLWQNTLMAFVSAKYGKAGGSEPGDLTPFRN